MRNFPNVFDIKRPSDNINSNIELKDAVQNRNGFHAHRKNTDDKVIDGDNWD